MFNFLFLQPDARLVTRNALLYLHIMFKPLGLFSARCPDPTCRRPTCFFAHGESSSSGVVPPKPAALVTSKPVKAERRSSVEGLKREDKGLSTGTRDARGDTAQETKPAERIEKVVKKAKVEMSGKGTPQSVLPGARPTGVITKPLPVTKPNVSVDKI